MTGWRSTAAAPPSRRRPGSGDGPPRAFHQHHHRARWRSRHQPSGLTSITFVDNPPHTPQYDSHLTACVDARLAVCHYHHLRFRWPWLALAGASGNAPSAVTLPKPQGRCSQVQKEGSPFQLRLCSGPVGTFVCLVVGRQGASGRNAGLRLEESSSAARRWRVGVGHHTSPSPPTVVAQA